jgi:aspartate-semialdehyde dehydrogenase
MAERRLSVSLVGATGVIGEEILRVLEERRTPLAALRPFASAASEGEEVEFRGEALRVEAVESGGAADADVVLWAAPADALRGFLPEIASGGAALVDLSGALELDPAVPLHRPGAPLAAGIRRVAVPRGAAAGIALALDPLAAEVGLERLSVVTMESASGAGRRGLGELSQQTLELLQTMTGDPGEAEVFPQPLAFDCLPLVGMLLEDGESTEERRLRHVVRRLLSLSALRVDATRVRVPSFSGSLTAAVVDPSRPVDPARARELWQKTPGVRVVDDARVLATPRGSLGTDDVLIGRVRAAGEGGSALAFSLALDDQRRGGALGAVEALEALAARDGAVPGAH